MTTKRIFSLEGTDGVIVFGEHGVKMIQPNDYGQGCVNHHIAVMCGVFDRLSDPLFTGEMIAHLERECRGEEE